MKRTINSNFFKEWSEDSAYILGYICADGCLIKRKGRKNSWVLNITSKDKEHLLKISKLLSSDYPVSSKFNSSGKICYQIQISSREVCKDVFNLGIRPNKTLSLRLPTVPKILFRDFARGYFDADGTVYIYKVNGTPQLKVEFCSASRLFMKAFQDNVSINLFIPPKPIHTEQSSGKNPMYSIAFYIGDGLKLFEYMYSHSPTIFLERKYEIFKLWENTKRRRYVSREPAC